MSPETIGRLIDDARIQKLDEGKPRSPRTSARTRNRPRLIPFDVLRRQLHEAAERQRRALADALTAVSDPLAAGAARKLARAIRTLEAHADEESWRACLAGLASAAEAIALVRRRARPQTP